MSRSITMLFAIICYAIFFATFLYLIVFVGDLRFATLTVDVGPESPPLTAAIIDLALIALFGLQHSVMARPAFKAKWTKIIPPPAERSFYVLAASIALIILFLAWRPIDTIIWNVTNPALQMLIWAVFWIGWATVLISTFLINHFELFGLQQAWLHVRGREATSRSYASPSSTDGLHTRSIQAFFLAFWATPHMTAGHLLLAAGISRLHADRHPIRGARPHQLFRRGLQPLSCERRRC